MEEVCVARGFKRDYWAGYPSYSGVLHDEETDKPINYRDAIWKYLGTLADGDVVEIIVRRTGERCSLADDRWVLLRPHEYGPESHKRMARMNRFDALFRSLDHGDVQRYVDEATLAHKYDTLVQSPEELGRWLALLASRNPVDVYAEVGVGAGGTFRLTRDVLRRHADTICVAIDYGRDAGFQEFLKWVAEGRAGVKVVTLNVDHPDARSILAGKHLPSIEACLLDPARTYYSTLNAFQFILPFMAKSGLIAFHNTDESECPDVGRAVQDIVEQTEWNVVAHYSNQFGLTVLGRSS